MTVFVLSAILRLENFEFKNFCRQKGPGIGFNVFYVHESLDLNGLSSNRTAFLEIRDIPLYDGIT